MCYLGTNDSYMLPLCSPKLTRPFSSCHQIQLCRLREADLRRLTGFRSAFIMALSTYHPKWLDSGAGSYLHFLRCSLLPLLLFHTVTWSSVTGGKAEHCMAVFQVRCLRHVSSPDLKHIWSLIPFILHLSKPSLISFVPLPFSRRKCLQPPV